MRDCLPRWATPRDLSRPTFGPRIARVAELLGRPLLPWQRLVAEVGGEIAPDGRPVYREIVVSVPRQSGKTTLLFAWLLDRCLNWGRPQFVAWTAQSGKDARDKLLEELFPLVLASPLERFVASSTRAMGAEAMRFANGSILRILASAQHSGHSLSLDAAVVDELWADEDWRREQGLRPAMATRPDAQLLVCSTAGTPTSVVWDQKVTAGREATKVPGSPIAYFEWSAPEESAVFDESRWHEWMPALGRTVDLDAVRADAASMPPEEFRRAYGNLPARDLRRAIPEASWVACQDPTTRPSGRLVWAVDVALDQAAASIAVSDGAVVELADYREGAAWVSPRVAELVARHGGEVVVDGRNSASWRVEARKLAQVEVMAACEAFAEALVERAVRVVPNAALDAAVAALGLRQVGDRLTWSRRGGADTSPAFACALAYAAAVRPEVTVDVATQVF